MCEHEEYEEECEAVEAAVSYQWSWFGLATDACALVSRVCMAHSQFWEDTCNNFARAHNRQVDAYAVKVDGEQFATSIMDGLNQL